MRLTAAVRRGSTGVPGGLVGLAVLVTASVTVLAPATAADGRATGHLGVRPDPEARSSERALALLDRVAAADELVRYAGVQFVSAWGVEDTTSTVVEVKNMPGHGTVIRVRGSGDGPAAAVLSRGEMDAELGGGPVELLASNYGVTFAGREHVAGRPAKILEVAGADGVVAARFWVDARTAVLLRREVYDVSGRTVRASAFVQVRIGRERTPAHLPPTLPQAPADELTAEQVADLRTSGCSCPDTLADQLALYQVRWITVDDGEVLHLSYSDGLSTVSLFEQPGRVDGSAMTGYARSTEDGVVRYERAGVPQQVVWSADGVVYALIADAPEPLVDAVVTTLPQEPADEGGWTSRVGRGLARVGSWVNPFA